MSGRDNFQTPDIIGEYIGVTMADVKSFAPNTIDMIGAGDRTESAVPHIAEAASTAIHSTANAFFDLGDSNLNGTSNDDQQQAEVTYLTQEIPRRDVLIAIIWMLLNLAPHKNNERFRK